MLTFRQPQGTIDAKKDYDRLLTLFKQQRLHKKRIDDMTSL
jgi:hypothetical protein